MPPRRILAALLSLALAGASFPSDAAAQLVRTVVPVAPVGVFAPVGAVSLPALPRGEASLPSLGGAAPLQVPLDSLSQLAPGRSADAPAAEASSAESGAGAADSESTSASAGLRGAAQAPLLKLGSSEAAALPGESSSGLAYDLFRRLAGEKAAPAAVQLNAAPPVLDPEPAQNAQRPSEVVVQPSGSGPKGPGGPQKPGGFWAKIKGALASIVNVLPDKKDNTSYWIYVIGQVPQVVASQFHVVALSGLAVAKQLGQLRTAHYASQALSSLVTGPWVDRLPNKSVMVWGGLGMALTLASIPALYHFHAMVFAPLLGVMVLRSFFQIFASNADEVAYTKIVNPHEAYLNKANATKIFSLGLVSMGASFAAGHFVEWLNAGQALAGNAWAYGVGAAMVALSSLFYAFFLKGDSFRVRSQFIPQRITIKKRAGHYLDGFKMIFRNRFLRTSLLLSMVQIMALDSFTMLVLPQHMKAISGGAGGFGTLMAASALGSTLAAVAMIFWGSRAPKGDSGEKLESDGKKSYLLSAAASLLFWGVYGAHGVTLAAVFYGLMSLLDSPNGIVWSSLVQKSVKGDKDNLGKIFSAMSVLYPIGTALGSAVFGLLLSPVAVSVFGHALPHIPPEHQMKLFAGLMSLDAVLHLIGAFTLFPLQRKDGPPPPNGGA